MNKKTLLITLLFVVVAIPTFVVARKYLLTSTLGTQEESFQEAMGIGDEVNTSLSELSLEDTRQLFEELKIELAVQRDMVSLSLDSPWITMSSSPVDVYGQARAQWFFEGSAPYVVVSKTDQVLSRGYVTVDTDALYAAQQKGLDAIEAGLPQEEVNAIYLGLAKEVLPFRFTLDFEIPESDEYAILVLGNDNPANVDEGGLRTALRVPVAFPAAFE